MKVSDLNREEFLSKFEEYLAKTLKDVKGEVGDAMKYATLDGGKRIRPLCVYYGAQAAGGNVDASALMPLATAVELIHSYSLVHDDMPEMDNDDIRRGKPSVHKKYGAPIALLAGDALLTLAMSVILKGDEKADEEIIKAAMEMIYGQAAELAGCKSEDEYIKMYSQKTGALIRGAFRAGAICASEGDDLQKLMAKVAECLGPDSSLLDLDELGVDNSVNVLVSVTKFAENLGIAYQLADDLLDGDKSIIDVIGKEETQKLLDSYEKKAVRCAKRFACAEEIEAFAKELCTRTA